MRVALKILSTLALVLALSFIPAMVQQAAAANVVVVSINCSTSPPTISPDPAQLAINQDKIQWTINSNCNGVDGFSGSIPTARVIATSITPTVDTGPFTPVATSSVSGPFTSPEGSYKYTVYACSGNCNPCPGTGCTQVLDPQMQLTPTLIGGTLVPVNALALVAPYIAIASILAFAVSALYLKRSRHPSGK